MGAPGGGQGGWWALGVLLVGSACGSLETPDRVTDLRLLAMSAQPPEQELWPLDLLPPPSDGGQHVSYLGDGGLGNDLGDGGVEPCSSTLPDGGYPSRDGFDCLVPGQYQSVVVTALVADPKGAGRPLHYRYEICAQLDADARCDPGAPGYQLLLDAVQPGGISTEVPVTFTPDTALLGQAIALDPYHGYGGLPVPLVITVTAGTESVIGNKLVVFTPPVGTNPVVPNHNPVITGILENEFPWITSMPTTFTAAAAGIDGGEGGIDVNPLYSPQSVENYIRYTFSGQPVPLVEALTFDFFATAGGFNPTETGGVNFFNLVNAVNNTPLVDSHWRSDPGMPDQDVMFWFVVHDGRGGESWVTETAQFTP